MPGCEGCGVALSYGTADTAECGHGSGYNCCNCAQYLGVYNEEQYGQYACRHCRRRLAAGSAAAEARAPSAPAWLPARSPP